MLLRTILGVLGIIATSASATVFDRDDRIVAPTGADRVPGIGIVRSGIFGMRYATGFLISRCHVLTTRHQFSDRMDRGSRAVFQYHSKDAALTIAGKVIASGDFREANKAHYVGQNRSGDWAIIGLEKCLNDPSEYLRISGLYEKIGQSFLLVGFPVDRSLRVPTVDPNCSVRATLGAQVLHDCATKSGNSGSPIIMKTKDGAYLAVAMHTAGVQSGKVEPFQIKRAGIAVPLETLRPTLANLISEAL